MDLTQMILEAKDLPREEVDCPEWGCKVFVRKASGAELDGWDESNVTVSKDGKTRTLNLANAKARLLVKVIEGADGGRVFTDAQALALGGKASDVIERLYAVAIRLVGRGEKKDSAPDAASSTD